MNDAFWITVVVAVSLLLYTMVECIILVGARKRLDGIKQIQASPGHVPGMAEVAASQVRYSQQFIMNVRQRIRWSLYASIPVAIMLVVTYCFGANNTG